MVIGTFNSKGVGVFAKFLLRASSQPRVRFPSHILNSNEYFDVWGNVEDLKLQDFTSRKDLASYLYSVLECCDSNFSIYHEGLWTWIAAYYFRTICRKNNEGIFNVGELPRWIYSSHSWRSYRHLFACPYFIYKSHGGDESTCRMLLTQSVTSPGDVNGQISASRSVMHSKVAMTLAHQMYFDSSNNEVIDNVLNRKAGTIDRYTKVINQLAAVWDLDSLSCSDLANLLPSEFEDYLQKV